MSSLIDNLVRWDACPLCGSDEIQPIGPIQYPEPIHFSSTPIALKKMPELWRCGRCHSGFVQHVIPPEVMHDLYGQGQSSARWSARAFEDIKTPEVVQVMRAALATPGTLVDVGANTGELLDFAKSCGCRTLGVELSQDSRRVLESKGHEAISALDELSDQSVDVLTAFDLVEHLPDINGFLQTCSNKLKPGGRLLILTGDIESLSARVAGSAWWYCNYPEHICFPSRQFLGSVKGLNGLKSIRTWAATGYRTGWARAILGCAARALLGRYRGLPSLGPDHCLHLLEKPSHGSREHR